MMKNAQIAQPISCLTFRRYLFHVTAVFWSSQSTISWRATQFPPQGFPDDEDGSLPIDLPPVVDAEKPNTNSQDMGEGGAVEEVEQDPEIET
ncbi:hypothetical protein IL306_000435 [Fusarium sp. DS 682]|nr:hypothetical protein IL306_000435 [Fusarium sp. DS 682]